VVPVKAWERTDVPMRTAHLLRINSYMDIAILSMWTMSPRVDVMIGMAEASLRGKTPGGKDDEALEKVRDLVREGREYLAGGEFLVAMGRMRVAHDLLALHIIRLSGE
jgi:adenosine/AMP kinase